MEEREANLGYVLGGDLIENPVRTIRVLPESTLTASPANKSNPADSIEIAKVEQGPNSVKTISQSTTSQIVADLSLMQRVNIDKIDGQAEATNNS